MSDYASILKLKNIDVIDSVAHSDVHNSTSVISYIFPILRAKNIGIDNNIWLAVTDRAGHVTDVYIKIACSDVYVPETTTKTTPETTPGTDIPTPDPENTQDVSVVTPKRMSIRLADGTVLKSGDSFTIAAGQEIKFQMCSNNWENDTYDDNGNGVAGTVVYTVKASDSYTGRSYHASSHTFTLPKGELVLRTDVNTRFMACRYHFTNGDYNKQTGIINVVSPLESLSVKLPLGSTITSDAYKAFNMIDFTNVFIETGAGRTLSYTDYYWNY